MHTIRRIPAAALIALAVSACSSDATGTEEEDRSGVVFVAGHTVSDTIGATPADSLKVQIRDAGGRPLAGVEVRFDGWPRQTAAPVYFVIDPWRSSTRGVDTTDADGYASRRMSLGPEAGAAELVVTVPGTAYAGTAPLTIRPGAAVSLRMSPADSSMRAGGSYTLRTEVRDRAGNAVPGAVAYQVRGTAATLAPAAGGATVTGQAPGVVRVVASAAGVADSTWVSVVPPGTLAAVWVSTTAFDPPRVMTFATDGSQRAELPSDGSLCTFNGMQWHPTGTSLVLSGARYSVGCHYARLYTAAPGQQPQPLPPAGTTFAEERTPRFDRTGQWLYFSAHRGNTNAELWRARPDGSHPERVGPTAAFEEIDSNPSPSPDGTRVAYVSNRVQGVPRIRMLELETGATRDLGLAGTAVSWSPDGSLLAFANEDRYWVARPDGTGLRAIAARSHTYSDAAPAWSPDGRWLAVVVPDPRGYAPLYGRIALVDVQTGDLLPLGWSGQMTHPAWKP